MSGNEQQQQSKEPKFSKFTQQELAAWSPVLSPIKVLAIYFCVGVAFVGIGIGCLVATTQVVEVSERYDDIVECNPGQNNDQRLEELYKKGGEGFSCAVNLTITETMKPPIYVYYELSNFYQNHRRYVKSRSDGQLRGESSPSDLDQCEPQLYLNDSREMMIKPCGLTAWTLFNDSYTIEMDGTAIAVDDSNIAWETDVDKNFADQPSDYFNLGGEFGQLRGGDTINTTMKTDQRFIVWMRNAALPTFRKLWGKIDQQFDKDSEIRVTIQNRYNTYSFDGEKRIVLSTTSFIGGKNYFLGAMYVGVGVVSILCGMVYIVLYWVFPRRQGDISKLSWNKSTRVEDY